MLAGELNIKQLIQKSFCDAKGRPVDPLKKADPHRQRSDHWVEALADGFRARILAGDNVFVFSKGDTSHRQEFGANELVCDISVVRFEQVPSPVHNRLLSYVSEALWHVESEFARDSRQGFHDFNKLVQSSAKNKLFIGPQARDPQSLIEVYQAVAACCSGNDFLALVPHPKNWGDQEGRAIEVWALKNKAWQPL